MISELWHDLRYGLRSLRRSVGFTLICVASLALGIGANASIFSLVNAVLLRPLPVRDPGQLVLLSDGAMEGRSVGSPSPGRLELFSYPLFRRLREQSTVFAGLAAQQSNATTSAVRWAGALGEGASDNALGRVVSANYFAVLGVPAHRGRTFVPDDETAPGANPVVVLSHTYWQRQFAANPAILGEGLTINGVRYTVVGVTRPGFTGSKVGSTTDFWIPLTMQAEFMRTPSMLDRRDHWWLLPIGRLSPGASLASAEASVNLTLQQYLAEDGGLAREQEARQAVRIVVAPGAKGVASLQRNFREPLLALMTGVAVLLLIVFLNVSHLMLARALDRQREMSIRSALGASRARLMRQLLTEGLLLSGLGLAAGALVTGWMTDGLISLAAAGGSPLTLDVSADTRVLVFTAALALVTAVLLGLVPAWRAARTDLQQALRATSQSVTSSGSRRFISRLLMISQVAFSLVLLVGAGLLAGSLSRLRDVDKGFDEGHVLMVEIVPRMTGLSSAQASLLYDDLLRRVTTLPGVRGASLSLAGLLSGTQMTGDITLPGNTAPPAEVQMGIITPGYFDTVGMALARGRAFSREDHENSPKVAVINQTLAQRLFGGTDAVGKTFRFDVPAAAEPPPEVAVVGVVRDARASGLRGAPLPAVYVPVAQSPAFLGSLEVRAHGNPALLADQVRGAVRDAHPNLPVRGVRTMQSQVDRSLMQERLLATLSSSFGLVALFLVCVGLYGVISQWTAQRTREIGVRRALGATAIAVRWMVLRQGFTLVIVGVGLGFPAAVAASQLLKGLLFGVRPMDPLTLLLATLAMFAVAMLAAYLPARRASRVDPMMTLRAE